ncbi:MAG: hypothetical protein H0U53_09705 [Actinobacteria bacterium]|nr:hypothetical protein [Actinomycetota bacterium]
MTKLKVEIFHDHEVDLWGFSVPLLSIIGTGCLSREDAERYVLDAIEFTLEEGDAEPTEGADIVNYELSLRKVG